MANPIAAWHGEHANFIRLLDLLEGELAVFHDDQGPDYELMLDILNYLREYPDRYHHPREDVAFERLLRHDPTLRLPVNRLLQEHRVIAVAGEELLALLNQVVGDAFVAREQVEAAAAIYLSYYRHHLHTEETHVLPRAQQLLDAHDWRAVAEAVELGVDPLFGPGAPSRYRVLRERLAGAPSGRESGS